MSYFFAVDYNGPAFQLFGWAHLMMLGVIASIIAGLICCGSKFPLRYRVPTRYTLAAVLLINELFWHGWMWFAGQWHVQTMLPLHFCGITVILAAIMLISNSYRLYELVYLIGVSASIQALVTPDLGSYGFPHARFFQFFISHGTIIVAAVYMATVGNYRPTFASLIRVILIGCVYTLCVGGINALLGSNYLFIAHKPNAATAMDILPAWPWYIPFLVLGGVISILLLYLPFMLRRRNPD